MKIYFTQKRGSDKNNNLSFKKYFFALAILFVFLTSNSIFSQTPVVNKSTLSITCGSVYASGYSGGRNSLYELNGSTMIPVFTAPQFIGGLAISANGNAYYDNGNFTASPLYNSDSVSQIDTGAIVNSLFVGETADAIGNVFYINNVYHLRENVFGSTGNSIDLGAIIFNASDTIGPTLAYGDMTFDGNGRLFWYSSSTIDGKSYLYYIDRVTLDAYNLGNIGPNGATGLAFDTTGKLITTSNNGSNVVSVDLSLPSLEGIDIGIAEPSVFDLGSCATPLFNPALITTKSVANITTGINPATIASPGDILEYTIVVNNTGNLISNNSLLTDAIPVGTTYVPNSTAMNGNLIADISGNMPFATSNLINSPTELPGNINVGSTATITFRVIVDVTTIGMVSNTASATFPTVDDGITTQTVNSNTVIVSIEVLNPILTATKSVANITTGVNPATIAHIGDVLEYTIVVSNTGNGISNNSLLADAIPVLTTYVPNSTMMNGNPVADMAGNMPFATSNLINSPTELSGIISVGSISTITFRVTVDANATGTVSNTATVTYPTVNGGVTTTQTTDSNTVIVSISLEYPDIEIHNYFSPDGDGINEVFFIEGINSYPDNTVEIYNRWGVLVYDASGYNNTNKSFNGISNGRVTVNKDKYLPEGTYYYVLRYKNQFGVTKENVGYLFMNR